MSSTSQSALDGGFRLETFLPHRLDIVTNGVANIFAQSYDRFFRLTIPEWRVLAAVAQHGTLSPTAVGRHTTMDKVKVSRAAQSLAAKGLIRQNQDPRDGRGRLLRLTRKGTSTHAGMVPLAAKLESDVFGILNRAELASLNRILTKIATRLQGTAESAANQDEET